MAKKTPQQHQAELIEGMAMKDSHAPSTNLVDIRIPTPPPVMEGAQQFLEQVKTFTVATAADYTMLATARGEIANRWNKIEADRKKLKEPSLQAGRLVDEFFQPALAALVQAKNLATEKLTAYDNEQRRIAAEKQRIADENARKQREEAEAAARAERERAAAEQRERERIAAAAKAEEDRIAREAAEARAREEESRRKAAEAAAAGDKEAADKAKADAAEQRRLAIQARTAQLKAEEERAKAEAETERLRQEADARAIQLENRAATVMAEQVRVETVEVAGMSRTTTWDWELLDKSKVKGDYLILDEKAIGALVRSMKERAADVVGGIRVFPSNGLRQQKK